MKKILSLLLAALMLFSFAACTGEAPASQPSDTTAPPDTTAAPEPTDTTAPAETVLTPNLPDVGEQYKDTEFVILHRGMNNTHYNEPWVFAENVTGDTINDAVFKRNQYIEEKYGLKIREQVAAKIMSEIALTSSSQDDVYDIAYPQVNTVSTNLLKGMLYDFSELPYINTNMPWWDSNCVEATTYHGQYFLAISDISLGITSSARGMIFNRELIRQYQLEDPYELVKNNAWTLDKLAYMVQTCSDNLDGDDAWTDADRY